MSLSQVDAALAVAAAGLPVFPCRPENKSPLTKRGFHDASPSPDQIRKWWAAHPDALVGVPTGKPSKLVVIDFDDTPEAEAWRLMNDSCGARVHQTRRGEHWLYALDDADDVRSGTNVFGKGIDVRANGGYIIWWPAHGLPASGPSALNVPPPPAHVSAGLKRGDAEAPAVNPQTMTPDAVERALPSFNPDSGYDEWIQVGMAVHSASGGAKWGFDLWNEWSRASPKYDASTMRGHWKSFKTYGGISAGLLLQHSVAAPDDFELLVEVPKPSKLQWVGDMPEPKPFQWIIEGFIPRCEVFALYGAPKAGKSYVLLDMALSVARGEPWQGRATEQGPVVWVAAEGDYSTRLRIWNYMQQRKCPPPPLHLYRYAPQLGRAGDVQELLEAVEPIQPSLILIDALIGVTRGMDENGREVAEVLQRAATLLNQATGATVGVIHHAGKDPNRGMRGSTAILGVVEAALRVSHHKPSDTRTLLLEDGRDVEGGNEFHFHIDTVDGWDIVPATAPREVAGAPKGKYKKAMFEAATANGGRTTKTAVLAALKLEFPEDKPETLQDRLTAAWKAASQEGWCMIEGDVLSLEYE